MQCRILSPRIANPWSRQEVVCLKQTQTVVSSLTLWIQNIGLVKFGTLEASEIDCGNQPDLRTMFLLLPCYSSYECMENTPTLGPLGVHMEEKGRRIDITDFGLTPHTHTHTEALL